MSGAVKGHLVELVKTLGLSEVKSTESSQECPFCHRPNKFKLADTYFRCHHPDCVGPRDRWNRVSGDIYTLLIGLGKAANFSQAKALVETASGKDGSRVKFRSRSQILEKAFEWYVAAAQGEYFERFDEFCERRHFSEVLKQISLGYAPGGDWLTTRPGLNLEELVEAGLAYPTRHDYFQQRVIFPVRDASGHLVHLQGRSLDPAADLRWLSTSSKTVPPISQYLFNVNVLKVPRKVCLLNEGASDCLSVNEIEFAGVATFGVDVPLALHYSQFANCEYLIAIYDSDRYPLGHARAGEYKSWGCILPRLIELQERLPDLKIYCVELPDLSGVKDLNDWLVQGLTYERLSNYLADKMQPLTQFAFRLLGHQWQHQASLIQLVEARGRQPQDLQLLSQTISQLSADNVADYVLNLVREL